MSRCSAKRASHKSRARRDKQAAKKGSKRKKRSARRRRPTTEELREKRAGKKRAYHELRERQAADGMEPRKRSTIPNRTSRFQTQEEEQQAREKATLAQIELMRSQLPRLLEQLNQIPDCRDPKRNDHRLVVLMMWGILAFVYQMSSRREANRVMTKPMFLENLRTLFPELALENAPHMDTVNRLLSGVDVDKIEEAQTSLISSPIRKKTFRRYLKSKRYCMAIDGTQKLVRKELLSEEWLERHVRKGDEDQAQYYVYVLEVNLVFPNRMSIPVMTEFLEYTKGDTSRDKQDCELRAFYRLAKRLKKQFPCLQIMVLADGLYANGPVMAMCRKYNWDFMIVLQDDSLPSVWEEYTGLGKLEPGNCFRRTWGDRKQLFRWVNRIEYCYGSNGRKRQTVHVVVCEEEWQDIDPETHETITKTSRHAWLSGKPLTKDNLHDRCNLAARYRWAIEENMLVEKHHGYHYEHCFSYDWNAMKGFHYLMRIAHLFNVLVQYSVTVADLVREFGIRGFLAFVRETMTAPWLDLDAVRERQAARVPIPLT